MSKNPALTENLINATIVVIGDIGHSPRMCNHAYSLACQGANVRLVGYIYSIPHENISSNNNISFIRLPKPPKMPNLYLQKILKLFWISFFLFKALVFDYNNRTNGKQKNILILQNPPGLPTMFVCYLVAKIKKMFYVIDWHNYTFSMFHAKMIAKIIEFYEGFMGRRADLNFCVSESMMQDLNKRWGLKATVLYDRPPIWMSRKSFNCKEKYQFLGRILRELISKDIACSNILNTWGTEQNELFTFELTNGTFKLKENRPIILISSTSWTPDEDFSILLSALQYYDNFSDEQSKNEQGNIPKMIVIITGKGPLKEMYLEKIKNNAWKNVLVLTAWLKAEEYPMLLSSADLGVCLHTSTSGFDLPMKIVDMFGCRLPVLAKRFPAISELVKDGVNGILFDDLEDLKFSLIRITNNFPKNEVLLKMVKNLDDIKNWEQNWLDTAWPLLRKI